MNIRAKEGTKVKYLNENGTEYDKEYANKYLIKDNIYTVCYINVSDWSSHVCFKELPDKYFNTVMFEEV